MQLTRLTIIIDFVSFVSLTGGNRLCVSGTGME